jgi:hypothetical protein
VKHCQEIDMDVTPAGAVFKGAKWPSDIKVERGLLDYLPGPHVTFGRAGVLRFTALNGYALYRRVEEAIGGWNYALVEKSLKANAPALAKAKPGVKVAGGKYRHNGVNAVAFQWLPDAVPPVVLPDWFLNSDFEHKSEQRQLLIRKPGAAPLIAHNGDWVVLESAKIFPVPPKQFAEHYRPSEE